MTDMPDLTPLVPPVPAPPPIVPPGTPAGRPRLWQAVLLLVAFGGLAGGSCAAFLNHPSGGSSDAWSLLFVATVPLAAGAFALLVFRLWRRRVAEAWPSLGQAALLGLAGCVLAVGGCGGWAASMDVAAIGMPLGAVFVLGTALAVGAGELFCVAIARLILAPRK